MKACKLVPYREFITKKLEANQTISQICKDLAAEGCKVSRSYLSDWIKSSGIDYKPRRRGRPRQAERQLFELLPQKEGGRMPKDAIIFAACFLACLVQDASVGTRKNYMIHRGLPLKSSPVKDWKDLKRYVGMSDLELMTLAYLRSDLGPPQLNDSRKFKGWFVQLVELAVELRMEIETAWGGRKS